MSVQSDAWGIYSGALNEFTNKAIWRDTYVNTLYANMIGALGDLVSRSGWTLFEPTSIVSYSTYADPLWTVIGATGTLSLANFPTAPTTDMTIPDPPTDPAEPSYGDEPDKPTYDIPEPPDLHTFTVPDIPPLNLPSFNEVLGIDTSIVPAVSIDQGSLHYDTSLLDALLYKLEYDIENGGTGLSSTVEDAIWERENEREAQALADAVDKLEDQFARKAFTLPSSLLAEQTTILHKDYQFKRLDRARDIAIKQAELEQENIKHRLGLAVEIEKQLSSLWEQTQTRILNASVKVAEFAYEAFKSQLAKYNAAIEAYKAKSEVYKNQIQAEIAKVEAYKAQIEGLKAIAQLDEAMVQAYVGQIQAITALIENYKAEVQAYVARIEGEKAKIDIFKARVEAWGLKVKAIIDIFQGQLEGSKSWLDGYTKIENVNVQGLGESVRAYAAYLQAQASVCDAQIRAATEATAVHVEAHKTMATVYSSLFSAFCLSVQTHANLTGYGAASESYSEQYSGSL